MLANPFNDMTLRYFGASTPFNPVGGLTGLLGLWQGDAGTYQDFGLTTPAIANLDPVGGWADQSGNGNKFINGTSGELATLNTSSVNSRNTVGCANNTTSTKLYLASAQAMGGKWTVYAVCKRSTTQDLVLLGNSGDATRLMLTSADSFVAHNGILGTGTATGMGNGVLGYRVRRDTSNVVYLLPSGAGSETSLGTITGFFNFDEVFSADGSSKSSAFNSEICELALISADTLTDHASEDTAMKSWLATRWGFSW